jgi:hypothetical protein
VLLEVEGKRLLLGGDGDALRLGQLIRCRDEAVATIKRNGGEDVTSGQQILVPKGEPPPSGSYWAFRDYDAVIALAAKDVKVVGLTFWTKKDFDESKSHRAKTEQRITALKIDTKTRGVSIEKKKDAG